MFQMKKSSSKEVAVVYERIALTTAQLRVFFCFKVLYLTQRVLVCYLKFVT